MKNLTMVVRFGSKNMSSNQMTYAFVSDDYSFIKMSGNEVIDAIINKKFNFTNMGVEKGQLISTNGVLDRYTLVDTVSGKGQIIGKPAPVVLNRIEVNGKLVGYTIFNTNMILQEVKVDQAVKIHSVTPFANGKIRHTQSGDIIQSIVGNYPIRVVELKKVKQEDLSVDLVFTSKAIGKNGEKLSYAGVFVNSKNVGTLTKVYNKLVEHNKSLINKAYEVTGDSKVKTSFAIQTTANSGFYGVFSMDIVKELVKRAGNKIKVNLGNIIISAIDFTDDDSPESKIVLSKKLDVVNTVKGNDVSDRLVKQYKDELMSWFKGLKVE